MDIIQCRSLFLEERLELLDHTIAKINQLAGQDDLGQGLNQIINDNYDKKLGSIASRPLDSSQLLAEHFLVNFLFKKPLFLFGLEQGNQLLIQCWCKLNTLTEQTRGKKKAVVCHEVFQEMEFLYTHQRTALGTGG
jgi:lysine-N-methylase